MDSRASVLSSNFGYIVAVYDFKFEAKFFLHFSSPFFLSEAGQSTRAVLARWRSIISWMTKPASIVFLNRHHLQLVDLFWPYQ